MSEIEDDEFEKLLLEKQHREMISSLRQLVSSLDKVGSKDTALVSAIHENSQIIMGFIEKANALKPPVIPSIELNQEDVIAEIKALSGQLIPFLSELKNLSLQIENKKPIQWEFSIDRGFGGRIEKIIAKPK